MSDTTLIETKIKILSDFYLAYKGDERFSHFFKYNDLGLPLAYAVNSGIVPRTDRSDLFVEETFELLFQTLGYWSDEGFETVEEMVNGADV